MKERLCACSLPASKVTMATELQDSSPYQHLHLEHSVTITPNTSVNGTYYPYRYPYG